jgi:hypothetical protein
VGKLTSVIGGMLTVADSIDEVDSIRADGSPNLFEQVWAPSTLGFTCAYSPRGTACSPGSVRAGDGA